MTSDPKLGRAAALRDAMLAYMNDKSSPLNAYPAFWRPFSIIGEGAARWGAGGPQWARRTVASILTALQPRVSGWGRWTKPLVR
jgi:hypothetical protein